MLERSIELRLVRGLSVIDRRISVMKFTPRGRVGYQDRIVLLPGGIALFVELKRPGETLRKLQEHTREEIQKLGFVVVVADTNDRVDAFLGLVKHVIDGGPL